MKIIIVCDSFKGSLTSQEVAQALREGIAESCYDNEILTLGMSDGGEGFTEAMLSNLGGKRIECKAHNALFSPIRVEYGVYESEGCKTALIDVASSCGLTLITNSDRDVMQASSFGVGEMIIDAYNNGCKKFIIGLGGSATCDCGMGMLSALGMKFLDEKGDCLLPIASNMINIHSIDSSQLNYEILDSEFLIANDVDNPLFGKSGAAYIFAPQKGASEDEVEILDKGLRHISKLMECESGRTMANAPGAGAAGGLGFSFLSFFNTEMKSGADMILNICKFDTLIKDADIVITGEGKIDSQTLHGKLPFAVAQRCIQAGVPVIAVAGCAENIELLTKAGFDGILTLSSLGLKKEESMRSHIAKKALRKIGKELSRRFASTQ